jgi:ATP-dependent HslUV protease ATP-binding subunit HslU
VKLEAVKAVEQNGIVFLDESTRSPAVRIARCRRVAPGRAARPAAAGRGDDGVDQVRHDPTDHILFIASGAFHLSKPSDLIPELQGRFPIRVELDSLSVADFECILTQTDACLTRQYQALLATEGVRSSSPPDGIRRLAEIAFR